jgi:hypothetical protein
MHVWHTEGVTDEELQAAVAEYNAACEQALDQRDAKFRRALAQGRSQAEIIRATGYSRETIRQALNPTIREALNARRRKTSPR